MAKKFKPLFEFTGKQLSDLLDQGLDGLKDKINRALEKGNVCRIRFIDPEGNEKFQTTLTIGVTAIALSLLIAPLISILTVIAASTAIAITDYKLEIDEVIEENEKSDEESQE